MTFFLNVPFYSLIVSVSLSVLWCAWRIMRLRKLTHWHLNRVVLLLIPIFSLLVGMIPFLIPDTAPTTVEVNPVASPTVTDAGISPLNFEDGGLPVVSRSVMLYISIIYWIGFVLSMTYMLVGLSLVFRIIREAKISADNDKLLFAVKGNVMPFSWGRWVVMSESDYRDNGSVILIHEMKHLHGRHWLDLLLVNAVKALTWYCPISYVIAHDIAENHEFEADNAVIQAGYNASDYQLFLVNRMTNRRFANSAVCGINNPYSLIKTRILMMKRKKSRRSAMLRVFGFIPVAILLAVAAKSPLLAVCVQTNAQTSIADVVQSKKVSEAAIMLTDDELMKPRPGEIQLPKSTKEVYTKWSRELRYPYELAAEGKQGRVILKVHVTTHGEITEGTVFRSSGHQAFDDEAIRAIKGTTGLTSATYNGINADIDCLMPVTFKSQSGPELPAIGLNSGFMLDEIVVMGY